MDLEETFKKPVVKVKKRKKSVTINLTPLNTDRSRHKYPSIRSITEISPSPPKKRTIKGRPPLPKPGIPKYTTYSKR